MTCSPHFGAPAHHKHKEVHKAKHVVRHDRDDDDDRKPVKWEHKHHHHHKSKHAC